MGGGAAAATAVGMIVVSRSERGYPLLLGTFDVLLPLFGGDDIWQERDEIGSAGSARGGDDGTCDDGGSLGWFFGVVYACEIERFFIA